MSQVPTPLGQSALSIIADVAGILSLLITGVLWWKSDRLKEQLKEQAKNYSKNKEGVKTSLKALRQNVFEDSFNNLEIRSKIRTMLYESIRKYRRLFSGGDWLHLYVMLHRLNGKKALHRESFCRHMDYIIARFD